MAAEAAPQLSRDPLDARPCCSASTTTPAHRDAPRATSGTARARAGGSSFALRPLRRSARCASAITVTLASTGIGVWGNNIPVAWAFGIINFVWWIGIGHAGTLHLRHPPALPAEVAHLDQPLRRGDDALRGHVRGALPAAPHRAALVRLLAVPLPERRCEIWPQFKSPLIWDVFAVSTYFTVSLLFWFLGLIPDLAALRDASSNPIQRMVYGLFALGWRGSGRHWHHYEVAYLLLAGLSTPLVLSRPHHRLLRLRGGLTARLAHHHLPALLRRRRHLLRLRDGDDLARCRRGTSWASSTSSPCGTSTP